MSYQITTFDDFTEEQRPMTDDESMGFEGPTSRRPVPDAERLELGASRVDARRLAGTGLAPDDLTWPIPGRVQNRRAAYQMEYHPDDRRRSDESATVPEPVQDAETRRDREMDECRGATDREVRDAVEAVDDTTVRVEYHRHEAGLDDVHGPVETFDVNPDTPTEDFALGLAEADPEEAVKIAQRYHNYE